MKRFISNFCLLVGASVASFAGTITGTAGTNLLGPNAVLINFDAPASFPSGSFTSLPSVANSTGGASNVSITTSGAASGTNRGTSALIGREASFAPYFGAPLAGGYISTYTGPGTLPGASDPTNFVRTVTFTFAGGASEFIIDYFASEANSHTFAVNGIVQANLLAQPCLSPTPNICSGSGRQIGFVADGTTPVINTVSFTFVGVDQQNAGDLVIFDNLVSVASGVTSGSSGSSAPSNGGGDEIPEPSTYALMSAGLLALAYARRKK